MMLFNAMARFCWKKPIAACQVGPAEQEVGTLMLGAKLSKSEYLLGWLAVIVLTVAAIFSNLGNLILSYFASQV